MMSGCITFIIKYGRRLRYLTQTYSMEDFAIHPVSTGIRYMSMEVDYYKKGMKNAETTLDSLSILCLDGKKDDYDDGK